MSTNTTQWPSLYQPQLKRAWRSLSLEFQLTYLSQFIFYSLHLAYYSATMLKNLCFGFQLQLNLEISRMVSFQLLLNSQQGPHFRTNSKIFLHTARLNSVNECFKFNDGCIDWEIDIMKRRFRTERVDFYFWLLDGKPINKWHTFSLGGLHLQDHREAWLSFSQLVELQLQHQLTQQ